MLSMFHIKLESRLSYRMHHKCKQGCRRQDAYSLHKSSNGRFPIEFEFDLSTDQLHKPNCYRQGECTSHKYHICQICSRFELAHHMNQLSKLFPIDQGTCSHHNSCTLTLCMCFLIGHTQIRGMLSSNQMGRNMEGRPHKFH